MSRLSSRHLEHEANSSTVLWQAHRRRTAKPSVATIPAAISRDGSWDRELDRADPEVPFGSHVGMELLAIVARLGLSLFITAGFAAAISLNNGMNLNSPIFVNVCGSVFLWTLALFSCVTSHRA